MNAELEALLRALDAFHAARSGAEAKRLEAIYDSRLDDALERLPKLTRAERATNAKDAITANFNSKQQAFLDFVLAQYVKVGVQELDKEKLSPLLKLRYNNAIADAIADLGKPEEIGKIFSGFQKYLYEDAA